MDHRKDTTTKKTNELVRVGSMVRYWPYRHVDHLLKSNVLSEGDIDAKVVHNNKRETGSPDFFIPIDNDIPYGTKFTWNLILWFYG